MECSNNNAIFNKVWQSVKNYGLSFVSSNGGTGKTTYFLFRFLRDALNKGIHFHYFVRFANQMEVMAERLLKAQPTFSNRQRKLLDKLAVEKEGDKFIYIIEKSSKRRICQVVNIYGQAFYKPFGNLIDAQRALFDEVLAENGDYCPDEINRFNRLIFTMARSNDYKVLCLYNNTSPDFEYFKYFGGKSFSTHVTDKGAYFYFFNAQQYGGKNVNNNDKSIQAILQKTEYNAVYNLNEFKQFQTLYKNTDCYGATKLFKIQIEDAFFWIREKNDYLILTKATTNKTNKKTYTINLTEKSQIPQLPTSLKKLIYLYACSAKLKTNNKRYTIFVKILINRI